MQHKKQFGYSNFASDLNKTSVEPTVIYEDNQSTICMYHGRAEQADIKFHFIREKVTTRAIQLQYCQKKDMVANVQSKGLTCAQFVKPRELLGVKALI